ncbi:glutaminase A [Clostridium isatidis]|uniref:glutaminase A n=1 Tax=Clostridium isatidis TaxID=182773 RepID=UPI003AAFA0FB
MIDLLNKLIKDNKHYSYKGKAASYIPALKEANPNDLAIALYDLNSNKEYYAGECDKKFTIQSISKVVTLIIALMDNGKDQVFKKVNVEPTGMGFNSIVNLEVRDSVRPYNPMINAGAIVTTSLIKGKNEQDKLERVLEFIKKVTNNNDIYLNQRVYASEKETGDRNRSIAYFMKSTGILSGDVEKILDLYFKHCSIELSARDLARFGAVIANDGIIPWSKERFLSREICRIVKTIMVTCGMYDASGEFAVNVGIPAKSGVGGGILGAVPKKYGIGVYGPALDEKGNSIAGINILKDLAKTLDLSIF